jgi:hypothetical protein
LAADPVAPPLLDLGEGAGEPMDAGAAIEEERLLMDDEWYWFGSGIPQRWKYELGFVVTFFVFIFGRQPQPKAHHHYACAYSISIDSLYCRKIHVFFDLISWLD